MKDDETWSVGEGEDDGKTVLFRIRNAPPQFATRDEFPLLLAVTWEYESPNDSGMPAEDDFLRMGELEEALLAAFETGEQAFLTVIATGNGVREWQWYARDRERTMELVNETLGEQEPFPIQFVFQEDPEWQAYSQFLGDEED